MRKSYPQKIDKIISLKSFFNQGSYENMPWLKINSMLLSSVGPSNYNNFVINTNLISFDREKVVIGYNDQLSQNNKLSFYKDVLTDLIRKITNRNTKLLFVYFEQTKVDDCILSEKKPNKKVTERFIKNNHYYDFANYKVNQSNQLAYEAAKSFALKANGMNKVIYCAGDGMGKTHLLSAMYNSSSEPNKIFFSMHNYTAQFVFASYKKKLDSFRKKYNSFSTVIIDNAHLLVGKKGTQREFVTFLDNLERRNGRIFMSSRENILKMEGLLPRLRNRFKSFNFIELYSYETELKLQILSDYNNKNGICLPLQILEYIASLPYNNINIMLESYGKLTKYNVNTVEKTEALLHELNIYPLNSLNIEDIVYVIAEQFNISSAIICSPSRSKSTILPRNLTAYFAIKYTHLTKKEIGRQLGNRSHSSIIQAYKKIEEKLKQSNKFKQQLNLIEKNLTKLIN